METLETHYQADLICFELIIEFFLYHNFQNTLIALRKEMEEFNYPWPDPLPRTKDRILKNHVPILLKSLDGYDHMQFFEKWSSLIPNEIKTHTEYKKLTIYLYTYFATLKYRDYSWDNDNENLDEYLEIDNQNEDETKSEDTVEEIKTVQKLDKTNGTFIIDRPSQITYLPIVEENISLEKPDEISPNEDSKNENEDSLNREFDTDSLEENELDDMDTKDYLKTQNTENSAMDMFKSFLAENGAEFTNDPEFLPFYALPFVENPKSHPAFNKVFEENWRNELKQTVEQFLINYSCGVDVIPQLVQLYLNNESTAKAKAKEDQSLSLIEENSKKLKDIKRKFHKLKKDYQKLIGVANELSSSLEKSVQGEAVNLKLTLSNCIKIFPDLFSLSVPSNIPPESSWETIATIEEKGLNCNQIDVNKVKYDLAHETVKNKLLLLQALRWSITKSTSDAREHIVSWFCRHDILCLNSSFIIDSLAPASSPHPIQQSIVRILNALCSFNIGRDYVSSSKITVQLLIDIAKQNDLDSVTEDMIIATLQKLSLRRRLADLMNENNILDLLLIKLETGPLKKYTLEYCTSLIMNLSIFIEPSFWEFHEQGVYCLIKLLKTPHKQVLGFVCGTLYCIVKNEVANKYCKNYGLDKLLTECLNNHRSDSMLEKQIDTLIRLHRREIAPDSIRMNSSFCSDDDLDDPEELESEIDENDLVKGNSSGTSLLSEQYCLVFMTPSIVGRHHNKSPKLILRPSTPKSSLIPTWARNH